MSLARLRVLRPAWPTLLPHKRWSKILVKQTHHRPEKTQGKTEAVKLAVLHPKDIPHYDLRSLAVAMG